MNEPLLTFKDGDPGRPEYTEEQYDRWLGAMRPFLEKGNSLHYAADMAGLESHYGSLLRKYNLNDWFCKKVDKFRSYPGESFNDGIVTLALDTVNKIRGKQAVTKEELDMLKFAAEKHRTAQPFFVTRQENAEADPNKIGKVLDVLEATNYEQLADDARRALEKQVVAPNEPVQDQGQTG